MTLQLPPPVALHPPDEDPAAVEELASAVTGGAFHLGLLAVHLTGPAAAVRGWVGRDATAAAAQVGVLGGLVRDGRAAVTAAAARLEAHAGLVRDAVVRVRTLQEEQHEELGAAVHRLAVLVGGPVDTAAVEPPEAVAVVEEWRAGEARRAREHATLLAELADDAAATARVLAGCTAVVGGTGAPGDDGRVLRHLALALPGWGDQELAGRGQALAVALTGRGVTQQEVDDLARGSADWVGLPAYADALLSGLGVDGVRWLLSMSGEDPRGAAAPVAGMLAGALGAARAGGPGPDPAAVLSARYVAATDPDGAADVVELGMDAVLAAGPAAPCGGPSTRTLVSWGSQVLARERAQQASAQERVPAAEAAGTDPVTLVVRLLARSSDAGAAAELLAAPEAFATLLARTWPDGAADLVQLVRLAGSAPGAGGAAAARAALEAMGEGLAPGSTGTWTVQRATAAALAPGIAQALTAHGDVLTGLLGRAGAGAPLSAADDAALRGLGSLTWNGAATATVLGAFVAVQQYGQRLDHALAAAAARSGAIDRAVLFEVLVSPLRAAEQLDRLSPQVQAPVDITLAAVSHLLGVDGCWSIGADDGTVFTAADAMTRVLAASGEAVNDPLGSTAAAAFDTALTHLGLPTGPVAPTWSWMQMIEENLPVPDITETAEIERRIIDRRPPHVP